LILQQLDGSARLKIGRHDSPDERRLHVVRILSDKVALRPLIWDSLSRRGICVAQTNHGGCHKLSEPLRSRFRPLVGKSWSTVHLSAELPSSTQHTHPQNKTNRFTNKDQQHQMTRRIQQCTSTSGSCSGADAVYILLLHQEVTAIWASTLAKFALQTGGWNPGSDPE
jgi:hypothetical protein